MSNCRAGLSREEERKRETRKESEKDEAEAWVTNAGKKKSHMTLV